MGPVWRVIYRTTSVPRASRRGCTRDARDRRLLQDGPPRAPFPSPPLWESSPRLKEAENPVSTGGGCGVHRGGEEGLRFWPHREGFKTNGLKAPAFALTWGVFAPPPKQAPRTEGFSLLGTRRRARGLDTVPGVQPPARVQRGRRLRRRALMRARAGAHPAENDKRTALQTIPTITIGWL